MSVISSDPTNITYSHVDNTIVNANTVSNALTATQWQDLLFYNAYLPTNTPITLTGASTASTAALSSANLQTAAIGQLFIVGSGLTGAGTLTVGADTAANAKAILNQFQLTSVGDSVVLTFTLATTNAAQIISLANTSGSTSTNVVFSFNGGGGSYSRQLFAASAVAGTTKTALVYANNVTSGSESVTFYTVT